MPLPPGLVAVGGQALGGAVDDVDDAPAAVLAVCACGQVAVAVGVEVPRGEGDAELVAAFGVAVDAGDALLPDLVALRGQGRRRRSR